MQNAVVIKSIKSAVSSSARPRQQCVASVTSVRKKLNAWKAVNSLNVYVFKNNISLSKTFGTAVGSGAIFFLISNFGVWIGSGMYSKNLIGLLACYTAGIPFLQNTIISNLLFTTVLFGSYYLIQSEYSSIKDKQLQYS